MEDYMKFILNSIRSVFRLIWRLFWGITWSIILSFIVLVGFFYFTTSTENGVDGINQALQTTLVRMDQFLSHQGLSTGLTTNLDEQTTQVTDEHVTSGARWEQAEATVYIDTDDKTFRSAYQEAIDAWNRTGAFTFTLVDDKEKADIIATEMSSNKGTAAGEAESQTNLLTKRFTNVTVRLNSYYLLNNRYGYTYERIVNTAEHELGHAIGLEHNEEESVMQSAGSFYSIQPIDVQAVKDLYQS